MHPGGRDTLDGMTAASRTAEPVAPRRPTRRLIPNQHGAWAMLALPFAVGIILAPLSWVHLPLALAWVCGYCAVYYLMLAVKTGRWARIRPQLVAYLVPAMVGGLLVAVARPQLLWALALVLPVLGVSAAASYRHADRSLLNDFVLVLLAAAMVPMTVSVGLPQGETLATASVAAATGLVFAYLGGTVLYVKTMIRERGNRIYLAASVLWHLASLALAVALAPLTAPVFAWFALRAWWLPRLGLRPVRVGVIEIAGSVALLVSLGVGVPALAA